MSPYLPIAGSLDLLGDKWTLVLVRDLVTGKRRPLRHEYVLTARGRDRLPVLQAFCRWDNRHFPGSWVPPESFMKPRS